MNQNPETFNSKVGFLYFSESNTMVNLDMIGMINFGGTPEIPSCTVHLGGNVPPLELHGRDVERLAAAMHVDFQAIQTHMQQTHPGRIGQE